MNLELPLDGNLKGRLRPISKAIFHSEFAMEAYLLIAQEDRFYKGQLAEATGCKANYAGAFLKRLESNGMVEREPQEEGQARHYYRKSSPAIWASLRQLVEAVLVEPEATVTSLQNRSTPRS